MIMKNKNNNKEFKFIRSQQNYIDKNITKWTNHYEIIIDQKENPNPTDLCARLKEEIKKNDKIDSLNKDDYIKININSFMLGSCTESEFIELVKKLDNNKYDI
ncbi:putative antirepressor [Alphaentomopoxvirus acuprea]|uniref:Putative antirepressor n=1 Tax=Alphaentomopoxvirus acuprea TaxID=62099 RepID=W6JJ05_9POXV|nr:putative antirepressor [Anomala cuprea entomopoxvirus]BAO49557.1 putative antirepressor [Anomala cuprea entomopoxvirus]